MMAPMTLIRTAVLVGLFSVKERDHEARLDGLEARLGALGVRVRVRFVQRRGVSDGGVRLLNSPLSRRFVIGAGKLREVAAACEAHDADAVVFANELTGYQRRWLAARLGRPVLASADLDHQAGSLAAEPARRRDRPAAGVRRRVR